MIEITKIQFWQIEGFVIKSNYHLHIFGDLDMWSDKNGKCYSCKNNKEKILYYKKEGIPFKIKYFTNEKLLQLLDKAIKNRS